MFRSVRLLILICVGSLLLNCSESTRADETLTNATQLYRSGEWQAAASAFDLVSRDLQQSEASRLQAQLYCGECLTQLGEYGEAGQRFQFVWDRTTNASLREQSLFRLGEVAWLSGDSETGYQLLQSYAQKYPQGSSIDYAKQYLEQIQRRESLEANYQVLDEAVGMERNGRYDEALITYQKLLRTLTGSGVVRAEALRRSAMLHQRLAQPNEAIKQFQEYLAIAPDSKRSAAVMLSIAWNHVRLDQTTQASKQFQLVLSKFPQSPQSAAAAYWLAQQSADDGNTEQSLRLLDHVLDRNGHDDDSSKLIGEALCLKCKLISSQDNWQAIEQIVETNKELVNGLALRSKLEYWSAEAAFRRREYNTARKRFDALQPMTIGVDQPWTAMVPLRQAQLAARRQQWREVLKILDKMEMDFPEFELDYEVDYLRGRALAGLGNMTAARKYYRRVTDNKKATETEAETMAGWMIGESFFHQRDYPRAREAYQLVMEKKSFPEWQSRAALQAGKCWELEKRWDEAAGVYSTALERWPHSLSEQQLESRLRWAQNQQADTGIATQTR